MVQHKSDWLAGPASRPMPPPRSTAKTQRMLRREQNIVDDDYDDCSEFLATRLMPPSRPATLGSEAVRRVSRSRSTRAPAMAAATTSAHDAAPPSRSGVAVKPPYLRRAIANHSESELPIHELRHEAGTSSLPPCSGIRSLEHLAMTRPLPSRRHTASTSGFLLFSGALLWLALGAAIALAVYG